MCIVNMLMKCFLFLFLLTLSILSFANLRKVPVDRHIYLKVEQLVLMGKDLHEASYKREKGDIAKMIVKVIKHVDASKKIIINDNAGAQYILELLDSVKEYSAKAQGLTKQEQRDVLRIVFHKITRITQRYYVGNYRTFYCKKTQDLWVQRHWVAKNPVHPKSRCGVLVN